ncbi:MAG: transcriptional regulator, AraC family [Paenibacillus sp.]|jgi:AraC-like DNA-binding protein|nr:transcriptional regulator, AraC family [Paenibacillus sp.]
MALFPTIRTWADNTRYGSLDQIPFHVELYQLHRMLPHRHEYLELSFVVEGESRQIINGVDYPLKPGTLTLLLPHQIHEVPYTLAPIRLYNCMFDLKFLFRGSVGTTGLKDLLHMQDELPPTIQLQGESLQSVAGLVRELQDEYSGQQLWKNDLLQMKLTELLIRFDRLRRVQTAAEPSGSTVRTDTIWSVIHHVHTSYRDPLSLSGVAERFGLSRSYLSAAFKRHTGCNFVQFLHEVRIRHACSLLSSSDMSGIDIAAEVGFTCFKSYSRIFREVIGTTPSDYRKQFASSPF